MATKIEWADETWNPVTGCTKISTACKNCYAERMTKRQQAMGTKKYAAGFDKVVCHADTLEIPLRWRKPRRIFVNSMSDLFHEDVPSEFIDQVFAVMATCPRHTFQVLTKRPERMAEHMAGDRKNNPGQHLRQYLINFAARGLHLPSPFESERFLDPGRCDWPLPNVHLGTTVENQAMAVERIPWLRKCPAAIRFLSCEPMLERIVLPRGHCTECDAWVPGDLPWGHPCVAKDARGKPLDACESYRDLGVDQVIMGCESGPNRRPCRLEWLEALVDQCDEAGVAPFVKQIPINGRVSKDPAEWPEWARREFPKGKGE